MEIARADNTLNSHTDNSEGSVYFSVVAVSDAVHLEAWEIVMIVLGVILGVLILMYLLRKYFQGGQYTKENRIDGKVVIITGCNTGIGKETAKELAKRGGKIYMACRDPQRCEEARLEIVEETNNSNVFNRTLDLNSLESIRKFVSKFKKDESKLDILINNAGIMLCPKALTKDGFETQIGVNHMGHFLLTNLLLDRLKQSAPSRIVVVSSMAYKNGKINKDDLNSEKSYSRLAAYSQSKLANILFTRHLSKKLEGTGVIVNCCHPGVVRTELGRHIAGILKTFVVQPLSLFFKTPVSGAQTQIKLAIDPDLEKVSGKYYSDCIDKPLRRHARDDETAEWLWKVSEEWTGLAEKMESNDDVPKTKIATGGVNSSNDEIEKSK